MIINLIRKIKWRQLIKNNNTGANNVIFLEPWRKPSLSIVKVIKCIYDKERDTCPEKFWTSWGWNPRPSDCQSDAELLEPG